MDLTEFAAPNVTVYSTRYYVLNNYAYTEDHVMVYVLLVYNIPPKTTVDEFRDIFSQYGNIKQLYFIRNRDTIYPKVVFVHYESAIVAARVLKLLCFRANTLYKVEASDSWHQPKCQQHKNTLRELYIRPKKSGEENQFIPNRDSLLVLNDDCLENIIRFLPISSQLNFAHSCSRIREVYQMASKTLFRTLRMERLDNMIQCEIKDFFDFAGDCILRIEGDLTEQNERIVRFFSMYCINLEELDLKSNDLAIAEDNQFIEIFHKLKKLRILKLPPNISISLSGIDLISLPPTIEHLVVFCMVEHQALIYLCKLQRNLKELNLFGNIISDALIDTMAVSCPNIETLSVCINQSDCGVAKLPKLKNLTVFTMSGFNCPTLYTQLVEHKADVLEFLKLEGDLCVNDTYAQQISRLRALRSLDCEECGDLTDTGLKYFYELEHLEEINLSSCNKITKTAMINFVLKCRNLKRVKLCYVASNDMIFQLIHKMQEQNIKRTEPIILMTGGCTEIEEDILNHPIYMAASHLLILDTVDYDPDSNCEFY